MFNPFPHGLFLIVIFMGEGKKIDISEFYLPIQKANHKQFL